jgi:hypothetical protein
MTYAKHLPGLDFSWQDDAACADSNRPADVPAKWFEALDYRPPPRTVGGPPGRAVDEPSVRAAIAVCWRCPVRPQCRVQTAIDRGSTGVRAGRYLRDGGAVEE